jgi:hypothetical protein
MIQLGAQLDWVHLARSVCILRCSLAHSIPRVELGGFNFAFEGLFWMCWVGGKGHLVYSRRYGLRLCYMALVQPC